MMDLLSDSQESQYKYHPKAVPIITMEREFEMVGRELKAATPNPEE